MCKKVYLIKKMKKISTKAIVSFLVTCTLCLLLISITVFNRIAVERLTMEQLIIEKSTKVDEVISHLLYKTQILSTLILQSNGKIENFERMATTIVDDPSILNILVAPNGVVSNVYPLKGNENVIGLNFFEEGEGNKEALMAKEKGSLVLGGPFNLVQGGQALVGRLPVFVDTADGGNYFWGLVSVTLKYPEALESAGLNELLIQGFAYEIWRINPDNDQKQIIMGSDYHYNTKTRFIERHIQIVDADWYFRILPVRAWYEYSETWILSFLSLCISFLVAFVMQNNSELKFLKSKFEIISQTDYLTGIFSRRYFMENVPIYVEKMAKTNSQSFIILLDIDYFKNVNDIYGHSAGDQVLKHVSQKIKNSLRSCDTLARYGGEEFIILAVDINKTNVQKLTEQIRINISKTSVEVNGIHITVTASFGIAFATPINDLDTAIKFADKALYMAKGEGRNKVVFYNN